MTPGKVMTWSADGKVLEIRGVYDSKYLNGTVVVYLNTEEPARFLLLEVDQPYMTHALTCKVLLADGKMGWLWSTHIEEVTEE